MRAQAAISDYDADPDRFRANVRAVEKYGLEGDVHESVARRLADERLVPVLDLGCGEGRLTRPARALGLPVTALDFSSAMLVAVASPRVRSDACRLPFGERTFGGVAALYMLYHLDDPCEAIAESWRVLRPGGLFVASAPSRYNDPELLAVVGSGSPATFDAENGPELIGQYFEIDQVEQWDAPLVRLPDREALRLYLRGRQLPAKTIARAIERVSTPLTLTKRGALIWGRKVG